MTQLSLRKVGGSVAVVIPPAMLHSLNLQANSQVNLSLQQNGIFITPVLEKPKFTLAELLAQSDFEAARDEQTEQWVNEAQIGRELL